METSKIYGKKIENYKGKLIDSRYEIRDYLGKGATGIVYSAFDRKEGTYVAIKFLRSKKRREATYIERFKKEAKAIGIINHENVVKIWKLQLRTKVPYIVSEYVDGGNLAETRGYDEGYQIKDVIKCMQQILSGLQFLHESGIIHKDIRPHNILLTKKKCLKVADFGVADFPGDKPKEPFYRDIGAIHYLSPELIRGDQYDKRTDIYSVGILMYRLLAGEVPFDSYRSIIIGIMHNKKRPCSIRDIDPNVPSELERIVFKAIEKDPGNRYQSAEEMLKEINAYAEKTQVN